MLMQDKQLEILALLASKLTLKDDEDDVSMALASGRSAAAKELLSWRLDSSLAVLKPSRVGFDQDKSLVCDQ